MPENKKYWYIQLNVNFFDDERIDWLCEQNNGYAYVVLYLKLCLKTANNNGILTRQIGDMIIPYNVDKIAEVTHMNVDVVRVALELYKKIGLVYEADENCNFMRLPEVPCMVGCVTQAALDKRKQRERKQLKEGQCPDNVQENVQQELRDKSKELRVKSLESEQDKEKKRKRKRTRFAPPTLQEVEEYAKSRNSPVDPRHFYDYFSTGEWVDAKGNPVLNWKQKFISWEKRDKTEQPQQQQTEKKKRTCRIEIDPSTGEEVAVWT